MSENDNSVRIALQAFAYSSVIIQLYYAFFDDDVRLVGWSAKLLLLCISKVTWVIPCAGDYHSDT